MSEGRSAPVIRIFPDAETLSRAAADFFVQRALHAQASEGRFSVVLAGGSTPIRIYELLAGEEFRSQLDWTRCHIFFGDERAVPSDHAESNYRMAHDALISKISVPPANVRRMRGEGDSHASARLYEGELREFFSDVEWPRFDLVMLGLGEDGHTASLFPGTDALTEERAWVAANWIDKLDAFRLTLTPPAINHAMNILFVVEGDAKAQALARVIEGPRDPIRLPAQIVEPLEGQLYWFVDEAAASMLKTETPTPGSEVQRDETEKSSHRK